MELIMANESNESAPTTFRPEITRRLPDIPGPGRGRTADSDREGGKKLIVGRDIVLNGKIAACDRLVVEGSVEATLDNSKVIEIAESGVYKGTAEIDEAVISGRFEGTLVVRGQLTVKASGRVSGEIRYGRIAIETGGIVTGTLETLSGSQNVSPVAAVEN